MNRRLEAPLTLTDLQMNALDRIGDYVLDGELGRGSFGIVWKAHPIHRPCDSVAVKVIEARGSVEQLLIEPTLLSRLDHPGLVRLLDYFRAENDRLVLVLELLVGEDIQRILDRKEKWVYSRICG